MKFPAILILSLILCSCSNPAADRKTEPLTTDSVTTATFDSSAAPQEIYDFMTMAIDQLKLDRRHGLIIRSSDNISVSGRDKQFLEDELLIKKEETEKRIIVNGISMPAEIKIHVYRKCLTKTDIDTMLVQSAAYKHVRWDNTRLGFDLTNGENVYSFSVPVFSVDRKKAVMQLEDLCPGLCGVSQTILFRNENGTWMSQTGGYAYH